MRNDKPRPQYYFDGGTEEKPEPGVLKGQPSATTKESRYELSVVKRDPNTGEKVPTKVKMTLDEILNYAQKGVTFEDKNANLNAIIKSKAKDMAGVLADEMAGAKAAKIVEAILKEQPGKSKTHENDAVFENMDKDTVAVIKGLKADIDSLKALIDEDRSERTQGEKLYTTYNENIAESLNKHPDLDKNTFVAAIKRLKIDPEAIPELADIMSKLKAADVAIEDLPKEQRAKLEQEIKDKLAATPPPVVTGSDVVAEKEEEDIPVTADAMLDKALKLLDNMKKQ